MNNNVIKSLEFDQREILSGLMQLHNIDRFDVDVTYGNGVFWKDLPRPVYCFDRDDSLQDCVYACSTNLPLGDASVNSLMFDPPFLTYIKQGRNNGTIMGKRFSGYWSYKELEEHYRGTITEAARVLKHKGIFVIKCQDIVHNHKLHATHVNVINWADEFFRLKDLYVLGAKHRLPRANSAGIQRHARIFHSYFMVFERKK